MRFDARNHASPAACTPAWSLLLLVLCAAFVAAQGPREQMRWDSFRAGLGDPTDNRTNRILIATPELAYWCDGNALVSTSGARRPLESAPTACAQDPAGTLFVGTSSGVILQLDEQRTIGRKLRLGSGVRALAVSADGTRLAACDATGKLGLWILKNDQELPDRTLRVDGGARELRFGADGNHLLLLARRASSSAWRLSRIPLDDPDAATTFEFGTGEEQASVSADGTGALVAKKDGAPRWIGLPKGEVLGILGGHYSRVVALRISGDGRSAVSAGEDGYAIRWELGAPGSKRKTGPIIDRPKPAPPGQNREAELTRRIAKVKEALPQVVEASRLGALERSLRDALGDGSLGLASEPEAKELLATIEAIRADLDYCHRRVRELSASLRDEGGSKTLERQFERIATRKSPTNTLAAERIRFIAAALVLESKRDRLRRHHLGNAGAAFKITDEITSAIDDLIEKLEGRDFWLLNERTTLRGKLHRLDSQVSGAVNKAKPHVLRRYRARRHAADQALRELSKFPPLGSPPR